MLPRNSETRIPSCSHDSCTHRSCASHSSSEGSPLSEGPLDSSHMNRSGNGCGFFARPSRMQVQRTYASRLMFGTGDAFPFLGGYCSKTMNHNGTESHRDRKTKTTVRRLDTPESCWPLRSSAAPSLCRNLSWGCGQ